MSKRPLELDDLARVRPLPIVGAVCRHCGAMLTPLECFDWLIHKAKCPAFVVRLEDERPEGNAMRPVVVICLVYVVAGVVLALILN